MPTRISDKDPVLVRKGAAAEPRPAEPPRAPRASDRAVLSSEAAEEAAARRKGHRIGVGIGAGVATLFNGLTLRHAGKLAAAGKPAGVFLGKVTPALSTALAGYTLVERVRKGFDGPDNVRKWDDALRVTGDVIQAGGGIAAFVPAVGLVPGLAAITAGTLVTALGDFFDDEVGKTR